MRKFVDEEIIPNVDEWEVEGIPKEVFVKCGKVGLLQSIIGWPEEILEGALCTHCCLLSSHPRAVNV